MWPTSPALKQNSSLLGADLVRLATKKTSLRSLSSPTPSTWPRRYSILGRIHIKSTWQLSSMNFGSSSPLAKEITLNFGNVLVNSSGIFTNLPTKTQNRSNSYQYSQARFLKTSVKKLIVITISTCRRWLFKLQMEKANNSTILLNCSIPKRALGFNFLNTPIHYVLELQEPSQITLQ